MNRLALAKRLRQECGIAGTGPATTLNQTGELKRLVDWIDGAWLEIQKFKWDFQWEAATVTVLATENVVAGTIPAHRYVQKDGVYNGESPLDYVPWADFRQRWPAATITAGEPKFWTIRPDKAFVVNAKPDANTDLSVERYKNPVAFAADTDEPTGLAEEHHMLIVWKAMLLYANFEEIGVTRTVVQIEHDRHWAELAMTELPDVTFGEPLLLC